MFNKKVYGPVTVYLIVRYKGKTLSKLSLLYRHFINFLIYCLYSLQKKSIVKYENAIRFDSLFIKNRNMQIWNIYVNYWSFVSI